MKFLLRRLILISILCLLFFIPLILYNIGVGREFNKHAKQLECFVTGSYIVKNNCFYYCNCIQSCETCHYDCYDVYVNIRYNLTNVSTALEMYERITYDKVLSLLPKNNTNISCYVYKDDIEIKIVENKEYYIAQIFFSCVSCLLFLSWFVIEILLKRYKRV